MLLTITTTRSPATDLGWLLHKLQHGVFSTQVLVLDFNTTS